MAWNLNIMDTLVCLLSFHFVRFVSDLFLERIKQQAQFAPLFNFVYSCLKQDVHFFLTLR